MALKDGRRDVTAVLPPFRPDLDKLSSLARGRAQLFNLNYRGCAASCGVEYTHEHHEIEMWVFTLMFGEYTADLILDKPEAGHSYAHKPCDATCDMNIQMARDFRKHLEQLVKEIGDRITYVEKVVNARKAATTTPMPPPPP